MSREPLVVLVCGGRDYSDWFKVRDTLHEIAVLDGIACIVHGYALGADNMAMNWAELNKVRQLKFPADWNKYGRAAGVIRNQQMLDECRIDLVVAFPGGYGTADMVRRARAAGIPVMEIK